MKQYENLLIFLTAFGTAAGTAIIGLQSYLSFVHNRRDTAQEQRQAARETARDAVDKQGVESVSKILDVVHKTQEAHLAAEGKTQDIQKQLDRVNRFLDTHQQVINRSRDEIEKTASDLAMTPRHEFRRKAPLLESLAVRCDRFERDFGALDDSGRAFSPRVSYVRGIAAHYANQPERVSPFLGPVLQSTKPEPDESLPITHQKRVASAYYFVGVTLSNFGRRDAVVQLRSALDSYPDATDFLTRLVIAEASLMQSQNVDVLLDEIDRGCRLKEAQDPARQRVYVRLRGRSTLLRVNSKLMPFTKSGGRPSREVLDEARTLIEPLLQDDKDYYYATATAGQLYFELGEVEQATECFKGAYDSIVNSYDLVTVTETRSRILLLMFAAICSIHGKVGNAPAVRYLSEATALLGELPKLEGKTCTVFSALSKWNEEAEVIKQHIEWINEGRVFAWRDRRLGHDRRKNVDPSWSGDQKRSGTDRRKAAA